MSKNKTITITLISKNNITQAHALKELAEVILNSKKWVLNDPNKQKWQGNNTDITIEPTSIFDPKSELEKAVIEYLKKGTILKAVKLYYDKSGKSLKESKEYIDALRAKLV